MATKTTNDKHDNELASVLEKAMPFFDKYGNTLLLAVAAILALAALFIYLGKSGGQEELGWAEMSAATSAEDYAGIATRFPGTRVSQWALLVEADSYQQSSMQMSFDDREASQRELKKAVEKYEALLAMDIPVEIREKAMFGFAKCSEIGCDGETAAAVSAYKMLIDEYPDSIYSGYAQDRIDDLNSPETKNFYAFWSEQNPKPGDRIPPRDATPLGGNVELPETPLMLEQSGFNSESEPSTVPDFTPGDPGAAPVGGAAPSGGEAPSGGAALPGETTGEAMPVDPELTPSQPALGNEGSGEPIELKQEPTPGTEIEQPSTQTTPAEGTTPIEIQSSEGPVETPAGTPVPVGTETPAPAGTPAPTAETPAPAGTPEGSGGSNP